MGVWENLRHWRVGPVGNQTPPRTDMRLSMDPRLRLFGGPVHVYFFTDTWVPRRQLLSPRARPTSQVGSFFSHGWLCLDRFSRHGAAWELAEVVPSSAR
jgi:hypothetical protein